MKAAILVPAVAVALIAGCGPTDYESCVESKVMPARTEVAAIEARNICDEKFRAPARVAAEAKRQAELWPSEKKPTDLFYPETPLANHSVNRNAIEIPFPSQEELRPIGQVDIK